MSIGWNVLNNRHFWVHDCDQCKYMYSIDLTNGEKVVKADIYQSCANSISEYIIRFSSEPSDYTTTGLSSLFAHFIISSHGIKHLG